MNNYWSDRGGIGWRFFFVVSNANILCCSVSTSSPSSFVYILRVHNRAIDNNVYNVNVRLNDFEKLFTTQHVLQNINTLQRRIFTTWRRLHSPSTESKPKAQRTCVKFDERSNIGTIKGFHFVTVTLPVSCEPVRVFKSYFQTAL